jgi:hypothetical protein
VRGRCGNPDAGAELVIRGLRKGKNAFGRYDCVLLRRAALRPAVAGECDPDAVADAQPVNARADLVDDAGTIVVGDSRSVDRAAVCAAA